MVAGGIDTGYKEDTERLHRLFRLELRTREPKVLFEGQRVKGRGLVLRTILRETLYYCIVCGKASVHLSGK